MENRYKGNYGRGPIRREGDGNGKVAEGIIYGRNQVRELLKSDRAVDKIYLRKGDREGSVLQIIAMASEKGIPIVDVEREKLDSLCGGGNHQGVAAMAAEKEYCEISDILNIARERGEEPFIVILDGVEDPYNLGAVVRCAECAGAHGVVIPKRRAAGLTPAAAKSSAGALEHMAVAKVVNIAAAIEELQEAGVWVYAAEADGEELYGVDMNRPAAFVFGSEGRGVSRLVCDKSDYKISIPMYGKVNSMNVSTAAAVVLTEAARQKHSVK
jgi:23S rRNA (guanosine2251-2'-O)-methyltransferase